MEYEIACRVFTEICGRYGDRVLCIGCPLKRAGTNPERAECLDRFVEDYRKMEPKLEKWAQEHPPKRWKDDFFEKNPNAERRSDGNPDLSPYQVGYCRYDKCKKLYKTSCMKCWDTLMEE